MRLVILVVALAVLSGCGTDAPDASSSNAREAPYLAIAGAGAATWVLAPGENVTPETDRFIALVTETACASGQPADDRLAGPHIVTSEERVMVAFAVRTRPGDQECPGNPATRVLVELGEPLGDRELLDGGVLPPRERTEP